MSVNKFISVFRSPTQQGTVTITISSVDLDPPVQIEVITPTIAANTPPEDVAQIIYQALKDSFTINNQLYSGQPSYIDEQPPFTFRPLVSDHVVTLWSQCRFRLKVVLNTSAIILVDSNPCFSTRDQLNSISKAIGRPLTLSDEDKAQAALMSSAELIAGMNGNLIVPAVYMEAQPGFDTRGTVWPQDNILYVDPEISRSLTLTGFVGLFKTIGGSMGDVNQEIGHAYYPDLPGRYEPYQRNTQVRRTYVAGYDSIPLIVRKSACELGSMATIPKEIASVKGGSGQVVLRVDGKALQSVLFNVKEYIL